MSDQKNTPENNNGDVLQATDLPVTVHAQYVRDLSFENPNAPATLRGGLSSPEMDVNVSMDAREIADTDIKNMYEVALTISATAKREGKTFFVAEVIYGMTVSIGDIVPEAQHHPILFIEIPRLAFPFARQIMATMTSQGGYPPVLLNPVDFQALYMDRFKNDIATAPKAMADETVN
tara:strand:- start:28029 stop:28559 length:531 start_codon:yes stop_codon:yes gene_type:complete